MTFRYLGANLSGIDDVTNCLLEALPLIIQDKVSFISSGLGVIGDLCWNAYGISPHEFASFLSSGGIGT